MFYTDMIKAAWMQQEFSVKFQVIIPTEDGFDLRDYMTNFIAMAGQDKTLYIHPKSLVIFEPQIGDIVKEPTVFDNYYPDITLPSRVGEIIESTNYKGLRDGKVYIAGAGEENFWFDLKGLDIIMRNGKHFFMPDKQVVNP